MYSSYYGIVCIRIFIQYNYANYGVLYRDVCLSSYTSDSDALLYECIEDVVAAPRQICHSIINFNYYINCLACMNFQRKTSNELHIF